jgi:hypothetical protein
MWEENTLKKEDMRLAIDKLIFWCYN